MEKKKCKYTTAQIGQYMMNKMSPEEETLFQEHLYSCSECQQKLQEMRKLAKALTNESLKQPHPQKHRYTHFVKVIVSFLLLFSGGYGIYLWQNHSSETPIVRPTSPATFHHVDSISRHDTIKNTLQPSFPIQK